MGWKVANAFPPNTPKCVIAVAPHTSSWDFIIGVALRSAVPELNEAKFLGKKELFNPPFGFIFRWLGGTPVDRSNKNNLTEQVAAKFAGKEHFMIAISPEGTRKKVDRLKTGFYHIAKQAHVPIVMAGLDFTHKQLIFSEPFFPTNDMESDLQIIIRFFAGIEGKFPENGLKHLLI